MTAAKDMSRPASQHRLSIGAHASSSLPVRNSYSRTHSHTPSLGTSAMPNRIGRRKSSTFGTPANVAALNAAMESGGADGPVAINRRTSASRHAMSALNDGLSPALPASLPHNATLPERASRSGSALVDGPPLSAGGDKSKPKVRRASDGTRSLAKKDRLAPGELKCETCGKAYKHGSCLTKHLWEHTPQWQVTSKLLISKHQQVQLLEAASVLVAMNQDGNDSDASSPAASGSSDPREEDISSAETTPPPQLEGSYRDSKRLSTASSTYSRSYQSVFSDSAPHQEHGFAHHRQWSTSSQNRPTTANTSIADSYRDEDPQDLAAAVGLLSCSYGTPKSGPVHLGSNIPPVPPLPAKYANHRGQVGDDVDMDEDMSDEERHHYRVQQSRIDEMDEGVFGNMD